MTDRTRIVSGGSRNSEPSENEGSGGSGDAVRASSGSRHFYLAIHKQELGARWFLSAYLSQMHPGAVGAGAGASLGTRIVSFRS